VIILMAKQNDAIRETVMRLWPWYRQRVERDRARARAVQTVAPTTWRQLSPRVSAGESVLVARNITVAFGNVRAVDDVSLDLIAGRVLGVIGPNGAGKTSLIDALTGFGRTAGGTVHLCGQDVTELRAFERARRGMGRTFQNLELFDDLTARENILTAIDSRSRFSYARDLFYPGRDRYNTAALATISMLGLESELDTVVADLPQGRRRMVAVARLAAQNPLAVLLDEPAAGLSGSERRTACELFRALADDMGAAVLLVEHNVDVVATTCDYLMVLDFGRVIAAGPTAEVLRQDVVRAAYLGQLSATPPADGAREHATTQPGE
jgi:ABC-type branched-subunit amino acid transport system ATPase component